MNKIEYRIVNENLNEFTATFQNLNEASAFLKTTIKEDEDEFAHRNYCITKYELKGIEGKESWVMNEKFGRMRFTAKTARGLLDDLA